MRFFKTFLTVWAVCFGLAMATAAVAANNPPETANSKTFEFQFNLAAGGAPGMAAYHGSVLGPPSTALLTAHIAARFRLPKYTPLVLEIDVVFPHGVGANLGIDILRTERVRVHIGDVGLFGNLTTPVSVARLKRKLDMVAGAGVEIKVNKSFSVTLDWRMFLPPFADTLLRYGDFARPMYEEALKGGQVWIGFSRVW